MSLVKVLDVTTHFDPEDILGGEIELPKIRSKHDMYAIRLRGWIIGKDKPVRKILIFNDGILIKKINVNQPRPQKVEKIRGVSSDENCGFNTELGILGSSPETVFELKASLANNHLVHFGNIRVRHQPLTVNYEPKLQPILITSLGRSGSTWMMRTLSAHPEIVVHLSHPYETLAANYWIHMIKVLGDPANHLQSSRRIGFKDNLWRVGNHPYNTIPFTKNNKMMGWFNRDYVYKLAELSMESIDQFYIRMARLQGQRPTYFAEKSRPTHIPWLFRELYPATKEIFLIRDFRDTICSMFSFNRKRGRVVVGPQKAKTDQEFIQLLRPRVVDLLGAYEKRKSTAYWVRYEDLVLQPEETIVGVVDYLGIKRSDQIVRAMAEGKAPSLKQRMRSKASELKEHRNQQVDPEQKLVEHQTTSGPAASIGRWRTDLSPELQQVCNEELGSLLEKAGYQI